jgi:hypothetical protein
MMNPKMYWVVMVAILLFFALLSPTFAIDSKSNRATLRGLGGVAVLVENLPLEVEKDGLVKSKLQTEAELKLKMAGIKVLTREESLKTPGEPCLYINININIAKTESDVYPYSIDALFIQKVYLVRDPKQTAYAVTWSTGGVGSITKPIVSQLQNNVEDILDLFIKAYLSENPK